MAVRPVITIAEHVLYEKSEPVQEFDADLRNLVRDMYDTMYEYNGVGLAAVQVGVLKRVLVIDLESSGFVKGAFINPEIVDVSPELLNEEEGCLSIPGVVALLKRPRWVKVRYQDLFGNYKEITGRNLMARALLHEMDHLDGKVFVDLLEPDIRNSVDGEILEIKQGGPGKQRVPAYRQ